MSIASIKLAMAPHSDNYRTPPVLECIKLSDRFRLYSAGAVVADYAVSDLIDAIESSELNPKQPQKHEITKRNMRIGFVFSWRNRICAMTHR